ncbi:nuclear transport factor 2 family protein [Candidatus Neomarinimicrobiota bacterium]
MPILKRVLRILFIFLLLLILIRTYQDLHPAAWETPDTFPFSRGNAPAEVRDQVLQQLATFQDGYSKRDTALLRPFMTQLFSAENTLVLGTMPQETCIGYNMARRLVRADWLSWGDCTFHVDNSHVSSNGDVAWFSTVGRVKFDLSRFLVLPLRLTGVMVNENAAWKFQHLQFQFDLDLSAILVATILLLGWLVLSILLLLIFLVRKRLPPPATG